MASLSSSSNTTQTGFVSVSIFGPLSSVSPGVAIRQVLSGESLRELESFQLLEGSPASVALALPLAHPQPPCGAWQLLMARVHTKLGSKLEFSKCSLEGQEKVMGSLCICSPGPFFRYGSQQRGGKAISATSP